LFRISFSILTLEALLTRLSPPQIVPISPLEITDKNTRNGGCVCYLSKYEELF